ncbi:hypothetical protein TruAng_005301 [Truncatella angustata]|nr:hypothetical protein TruAng_005301 [Truncatella angustata]
MSGFPTVNGIEVLLQAPDGYVVDLANPQRNGEHGAYWAYGIGTFLAVLFLAQRLFVRVVVGSGLQIDDDLLTSHTNHLDIRIRGSHRRSTWMGVKHNEVQKISTVYLRLSPGGWFKTWSWVAVGMVVLHTIVLVFLMVFSCTPVSKSWDITIPATEGSCINVVALYFATAIANIITDVMVMVLPIPLIMCLHMPKWQKIGVIALFGFASAYGDLFELRLRCAALPALLNNNDQTWAISQASLWAIIEANLVIICASMTTLKKFFNCVAPGLLLGSSGAKSSQGPTHNPPTISKLTSRRTDRYAKFGDDTELYPIGNQTEVNAGQSDRSETGSWDMNGRMEDGSSEKGIVQKTVVRVSYGKT